MVIEPFELIGKKIIDAYYVQENLATRVLRLELDTNEEVTIDFSYVEDEITGRNVPAEVEIKKYY